MITRLSHATVWVLDQDSALAFYTEKLGFEVRTDTTLGPDPSSEGHDASVPGLRWLTVGPKSQPDVELILAKLGPPMLDPESAGQVRALVAKGVLGAGVMATDDIQADFKELSAKGVTFLQEPAERPYGTEAVFRDDSGNWFSLTQPGD